MKKDSKKIKVFIIDDHPIVRLGLRSEFKKNKSIEVIGEAASGIEALQKIDTISSADVILMDISLPDMNGIKITEEILKKNKKVKILALSMHDNQNYILEMIRLGVMGYILKDSPPEELIKAIKSVNADQPFYSLKINELMIKQQISTIRKSVKPFIEDSLSSREKEILILIAEGCTNKEIAQKLSLSIRTVEAHRENIIHKLGIKTVAGLTKYAINNNLIPIK